MKTEAPKSLTQVAIDRSLRWKPGDLPLTVDQELDEYMALYPSANRGAVAAEIAARHKLDFADPKEIQNDGDPIKEAALPPEVVAPFPREDLGEEESWK